MGRPSTRSLAPTLMHTHPMALAALMARFCRQDSRARSITSRGLLQVTRRHLLPRNPYRQLPSLSISGWPNSLLDFCLLLIPGSRS